MKPLFRSDKNWERMLGIIQSWMGKPYKHLTMVKGRGADCTLFIGACWKEYGIITKVEYDYYPKQWHIHTNEEKVVNSFNDHWNKYRNPKYHFEVLPVEEPKKRGDLLAFSNTSQNVTNHASIYIGDIGRGRMMCHSIQGRGVSYFPYGSYWKRKMVNFYRVMEEG